MLDKEVHKLFLRNRADVRSTRRGAGVCLVDRMRIIEVFFDSFLSVSSKFDMDLMAPQYTSD